MKKLNLHIFIIFILAFWLTALSGSEAKSQSIDNKLNIYLGIGSGQTTGTAWLNNDGLIAPGLFANYEETRNLSLAATYNIRSWAGVGVNIITASFSNWELENSPLYANAESNYIAILPSFRLQTPKPRIGIFNRIQLYAELSVGGGFNTSTFNTPLGYVFDQDNNQTLLTSEQNRILVVAYTFGSVISINQIFGLYAGYNQSSHNINASLFNDTRFTRSYLEIGINIKLLKSKNYYR